MMHLYQAYLSYVALLETTDKVSQLVLLSKITIGNERGLNVLPAILALSEKEISKGPLTFSEFEQIAKIISKGCSDGSSEK